MDYIKPCTRGQNIQGLITLSSLHQLALMAESRRDLDGHLGVSAMLNTISSIITYRASEITLVVLPGSGGTAGRTT